MYCNDGTEIKTAEPVHSICEWRTVLMTSIFADPAGVDAFMKYIYKYFECSSVEYDYSSYTYIVKLKKLEMLKRYRLDGFNSYGNNMDFYTRMVGVLAVDFFANLPEELKTVDALRDPDNIKELIRVAPGILQVFKYRESTTIGIGI